VLPLLANYPLSKSENYNPKKSNHPISSHFQKVKTIIQKNQTIQFPHTSKGENYNPQKSNYPIYLTSKSENYNPKKSNHPISSHFKR
jgi:hypothetical protein